MLNEELLREISSSTSTPTQDVIKAFDELIKRGILFTPARSAKQFFAGKYPLRIFGKSPVHPEQKTVFTFGPFALKTEQYFSLKQTVEAINYDSFIVMLGFVRMSFEKLGYFQEGYRFGGDEDILANFLSLMDYWDVKNPVIIEDFVWIVPKNKCRKAVEKISGEKYAPDDFTWWDFAVDAGEGLYAAGAESFPEEFHLIPYKFVDWLRYLPSLIGTFLPLFYAECTRGQQIRIFHSLAEILSLIEQLLQEAKNMDQNESQSSRTDRELLVKELCDFNNLLYPTNSTTILDYLLKIRFITLQDNKELTYSLNPEIPEPLAILNLPTEWDERVDKFLTTGSILFSYLTLEEITGK